MHIHHGLCQLPIHFHHGAPPSDQIFLLCHYQFKNTHTIQAPKGSHSPSACSPRAREVPRCRNAHNPTFSTLNITQHSHNSFQNQYSATHPTIPSSSSTPRQATAKPDNHEILPLWQHPLAAPQHSDCGAEVPSTVVEQLHLICSGTCTVRAYQCTYCRSRRVVLSR